MQVESDWDMVYLARTEGGGERGSVSWRVELEEGWEAGRVEVEVASTTFHSGRVVWQLCGGSSCLLPQPGKLLSIKQLTGGAPPGHLVSWPPGHLAT